MIHEARGATAGRTAMLAAMGWYMQEFAYLLQRLSEVPEGDGTLLDHTVVLSISDFGEGAAHNTRNLPIVLAGGLSGAITTGRHLAYNNKTTGDLYTALLNKFGYADTTFGLPDHCTGAIAL